MGWMVQYKLQMMFQITTKIELSIAYPNSLVAWKFHPKPCSIFELFYTSRNRQNKRRQIHTTYIQHTYNNIQLLGRDNNAHTHIPTHSLISSLYLLWQGRDPWHEQDPGKRWLLHHEESHLRHSGRSSPTLMKVGVSQKNNLYEIRMYSKPRSHFMCST